MARLKNPPAEKSGRLAAPRTDSIDPNTRLVVFGFQHVIADFDLSGAQVADAARFIAGLKKRCSISWAEIRRSPRQGLGCEKISQALKVPVPDQLGHKADDMLCFRFGGDMQRFIGFQDGATFEVVWIDHSGQAYDH